MTWLPITWKELPPLRGDASLPHSLQQLWGPPDSLSLGIGCLSLGKGTPHHHCRGGNFYDLGLACHRRHRDGENPDFSFDFPEFAYSPRWTEILPRKGDIHGPAPGDTDKGPVPVKCPAGSAPTSTRVSPLHSPVIKGAGSEGPSGHDTPEKEGTEETGVGYFQRVLLVARTLDSQITAGAHLCRLCFLTRSLTPDSCVGCLPSPMPGPPLSTLCLFPGGRV